MSTRTAEIKATVKEWFLSSSSHGLPNIARNESHCLKSFWLICFIVSTLVGSWSVYKSFVIYFEFYVITEIDDVYENPIHFPTITLCNVNPLSTYEGYEFAKRILDKENITHPFYDEKLTYFLRYPPAQTTVNMYFSKSTALQNAMMLNESSKRLLGQSVDQLVYACVFSNAPCYLDSFKWYYHPEFGNCYQFNSGFDSQNQPVPFSKVTKTGKRNGLALLLLTGTPYDIYSTSVDSGAHIFIHEADESPVTSISIDVPTGMSTNIVLSKVVTQKQPYPYNDCYSELNTPDAFDSLFYRLTLQQGYKYSQRDCLNIAEQAYYIKKCKCAHFGYPPLYDAPVCTRVNETACLYNAYMDVFFRLKLNVAFLADCPLECNKT